MSFLSFTGITHVYLLKILITYDEKGILLLNLLINCILGRSAPQALSVKDDCTFGFSIFLTINLCSSSTSSWFDVFSFLTAPPEADLSHVAKVSDWQSKLKFCQKIINH